MSSPGGFFSSIRFKVVFWYTIFLAFTLISFSAVLYGGFSNTLYGDLDDLLSSKAEGITDSISTYWQTKRGDDLSPKRISGVPLHEEESDLAEVAHNWVEAKRKDKELMNIFSVILGRDGKTIASSRSMPRLSELPKNVLEDILDGEDSFDTVKGETADGRRSKYRVYSRPVYESGAIEYIVQVAGSTNLVTIALGNLRLLLFVLLPLTVILAAIPGVLLVRMTLRPVDTMVNTIRQITSENLKLKIHIPDTKDEIRRLADTFNDMIGRIDRSFSSQQRFIQDISHELKAPISIMKSELDRVLNLPSSEHECKAVLSKISKEIDEFSVMIEDLLVLGRIDNSQLLLEIRKVDMCNLAEDVLSEMKSLSDQKEIKISLSAGKDVILDGDRNQLRRILINLLDNAVKYSYRNGKVEISIEKGGVSAVIVVSDFGAGIPADDLPYIFDRFYQAARSRGMKNGFGLGLSSVRSSVEAHKGSISVKSQPGKGSSFIVTLPLSYQV